MGVSINIVANNGIKNYVGPIFIISTSITEALKNPFPSVPVSCNDDLQRFLPFATSILCHQNP